MGRSDGGAAFRLVVADLHGRLRETSTRDIDADAPDPLQLPYGAVVLPATDRQGNGVVVFVQPGCSGRTDVLVVEAPDGLVAQGADGRAVHGGNARFRIAMPGGFAVVRFATRLGPGERLSKEVKSALAMVRYTVRAGDRPGWFEHDDAFPDPAFRHGFPDIATREQGVWGIRGPSLLAAGLKAPISDKAFAVARSRRFKPGERVICEIHVGTFTKAGTFAAAARRLGYLSKEGFTTLQLMPVDVSSGPPGWTYDQTRTGAVDGQAYGGSAELIRLVTQAHEQGLEVIIDKQYNHGGPEQDSRGEIIPGMFARQTIWGPGVSGPEAVHYPQIVKLIGEEMGYWASQFGVDGFRLDATNGLPWELHEQIADFGRQAGSILGKPLYVASEYSEDEPPKGRRAPTGHQYTDETGRYVMRLLGISRAGHVVELPEERGSLLRPMLKAARRGWWYPDVEEPLGGIRGSGRVTALLGHHDWIGNRFGGERLHHLIGFDVFKALAVWQALGQWTPLIFMGTERCAGTPWFYFTGHQDSGARNHTSAFYLSSGGHAVLSGGRLHEFAQEAQQAGLKEALEFSRDGTPGGIDWDAFRGQADRFGRPYMDHARRETFESSKIDWSEAGPMQRFAERLFKKVLGARRDARIHEDEPRNTQYKAWDGNERVFVMRRRSLAGGEFAAFFNLGEEPVSIRISEGSIDAEDCGEGYVVGLSDAEKEQEWSSAGPFSLWLDTNSKLYGGGGESTDRRFSVSGDAPQSIVLAGAGALVYEVRRQ